MNGKARPHLKHLLDDINVSGHAEFPELIPKDRSVESELSSSGRVCNVLTNPAHRTQVDTYLDETLPICEVSFPRLQGEKDPRNILDSPQLALHYICDV
jgi:hypothetical protein